MSRKLDEIISIEERVDKNGKVYYRTNGVSNGDDVVGYGRGYSVGDSIMVYFDDRFNMAKMEKLNKTIDI